MPIFGDPSSPYDECVEKVTAETLTSENWALMIDICDRVVAEGPRACKPCLLSVKKRLNHRDPHVVLFALSLLDCLWNNCGAHFRREVSSKDFVGELNYKCTNSNRVIAEKARALVKKWVENECKQDSSLSLIESLYKDLLEQGYSFEADPTAQKKKLTGSTMFSKDPNVVSSEQEEADIAKAIALSLQDNGPKQSAPSNYPNIRNPPNSVVVKQSQQARQVKALYDFEAAEDNELSFLAGEIISVHDDSDQNWWRGSTGRGAAGLFPASFVTPDLNEPVAGVAQQNEDKETEVETAVNQPRVQIDEGIMMKCLALIESCDPAADPSADAPELPFLEHMSMAQAPLIDRKLVQIDKQLNLLAEVDLAIRDVLTAYDNAVQQVAVASSVPSIPLPAQPPPLQTMAPTVVASSSMQMPMQHANATVQPIHQPQMGIGGAAQQWQQQMQ